MRTWRITRVEEGPDAWTFLYEPVDGEGGTFAASFPKGVFEHRMAEHGLKSLDEAIEALMYEPLLSWMHAEGDPDAQVRLEGDAASARARLQEQIAACRDRYGQVLTDAPAARSGLKAQAATDPLQVLRDRVRIDTVRVATIRLEIDRHLLGGA
ncbi:hypothetical protein [Nonomuraea sp. CA-141351]|uniref:hypothetical protein n=1 Tax=Nonomuraea sp. CA-141351 TaxID=3239996 RepID=UPI003D90901A